MWVSLRGNQKITMKYMQLRGGGCTFNSLRSRSVAALVWASGTIPVSLLVPSLPPSSSSSSSLKVDVSPSSSSSSTSSPSSTSFFSSPSSSFSFFFFALASFDFFITRFSSSILVFEPVVATRRSDAEADCVEMLAREGETGEVGVEADPLFFAPVFPICDEPIDFDFDFDFSINSFLLFLHP